MRFLHVLGLPFEPLFAESRNRKCVLIRRSFFLCFVCFSEGSDPRSARAGAVETSCSLSSRPRTRYGLLANVGTFLAPLVSKFVQHFLKLDLEHMHPPHPPTPHHRGGDGPARPPHHTGGQGWGRPYPSGWGAGRPAPNHILPYHGHIKYVMAINGHI